MSRLSLALYVYRGQRYWTVHASNYCLHSNGPREQRGYVWPLQEAIAGREAPIAPSCARIAPPWVRCVLDPEVARRLIRRGKEIGDARTPATASVSHLAPREGASALLRREQAGPAPSS